MELSERTNFLLRLILFCVSLYFIFDIIDGYREIDTRNGIGIILFAVILMTVIFLTCLCNN